MSIDYEMHLDFDMAKARLEAVVPIALARAAEVVRAKAVERTPVGSGTSSAHLRDSSGVTVTGAGMESVAEIKYEGPYAAYQNRGRTSPQAKVQRVIRHRPGGGMTGFLTVSMVDQRDAAVREIADTIRELL